VKKVHVVSGQQVEDGLLLSAPSVSRIAENRLYSVHEQETQADIPHRRAARLQADDKCR